MLWLHDMDIGQDPCLESHFWVVGLEIRIDKNQKYEHIRASNAHIVSLANY